jgi:prepilin-type processing-associated H-X9-DG protein
MYCPKCGKENPEGAQVCGGCSSPLPGASGPAERPITKTSRLAIAAFVLGVLSLFTLGITAIPAVVLGIISLVRIEKSGGRLTGANFGVLGIVVPVIAILMLGILLPALARVRQIDLRTTCGSNLAGIGKAMTIYANDYQDQFPRAGGRNTVWGGSGSVVWNARNRFQAYQMSADGAGGSATISSCFYLLTKYAEVTPKSFICKGDSRTREFRLSDYQQPDLQLIDLWDFGPVPAKHCSYTYHMPFGLYALTNSFLPGMAVAADRSPWLASPAASAKTMAQFNPTGTNIDQQKYGNSISHQEDGQNVLFMDGHVYFEKRSYCAIKDDNIYTFWDGGDIRRGGAPVVGSSQPMDRKDSFLVHDPPAQGGK